MPSLPNSHCHTILCPFCILSNIPISSHFLISPQQQLSHFSYIPVICLKTIASARWITFLLSNGWGVLSFMSLSLLGLSLSPKLPARNVSASSGMLRRIWLVYHLANAPEDTLPGLLETISGWALEYLRLLVLLDFNVCMDNAPSLQARNLMSSMTALELSKIVSSLTHQVGQDRGAGTETEGQG